MVVVWVVGRNECYPPYLGSVFRSDMFAIEYDYSNFLLLCVANVRSPKPHDQFLDKGPKLTIQLNKDAIRLQNQGKNTPTQKERRECICASKTKSKPSTYPSHSWS